MRQQESPTRRATNQRRTHSPLKLLLAVIIIALLSFLALKMATLGTSASIITTYQIPNLPNTESLITNNATQKALAVDGRIAAKSENQTPRPIASTTKMILALAVMQEKPFEKGEKGETITITEKYYQLYTGYVAKNGSTTAVEIGEEISEYDALASVLLASSNNLADTLAIWAFGSLENYKTSAEAMLKEWGIEDTTIGPDASGYDDKTKSSAESLAKIGYHLLENPVLAEIVGLKSYTVPVAGLLENTNSLLGTNGVLGIKTGYGGDASGYCLVLGYRENGHLITTALLGADTRAASFSGSLNLVKSSQETLVETEIVSENAPLGEIQTWWGNFPLTAGDSLKTIAWTSNDNFVSLTKDALTLTLNSQTEEIPVNITNYQEKPTLWQRFLRALGLL